MGIVTCADGIDRKLGNDRYLNRLQEFLARQFPTGSTTELLRAELNLLSVYARKLNDILSKCESKVGAV